MRFVSPPAPDATLPSESEPSEKRPLDAMPAAPEVSADLRTRVARIVHALLRHHADAEDATQASMVEILRCLESYRGDCSFEGWAYRIAVRTTLRFARQRRGHHLRIVDHEPDDVPVAPPEPTLGEGLPRGIREYLGELPEARRTALVLRHALGYSLEEIAGLTGVPVSTVKERLLAAREQVRKKVRREVAIGKRRGL
jgi:RNA polymerase sigma-70 factor (ECF subfamily)